jgi:hypothetical protein
LFLTLENPIIKLIYGQLTNKYFDKRNLTAFKYPNENDFSKISNYITEKISYYNRYGINVIKAIYQLNIYLIS